MSYDSVGNCFKMFFCATTVFEYTVLGTGTKSGGVQRYSASSLSQVGLPFRV